MVELEHAKPLAMGLEMPEPLSIVHPSARSTLQHLLLCAVTFLLFGRNNGPLQFFERVVTLTKTADKSKLIPLFARPCPINAKLLVEGALSQVSFRNIQSRKHWHFIFRLFAL